MAWPYKLRYWAVKLRCTLDFLRQKPPDSRRVAFHAMFKNEAPYLSEWLDYHFSLGFDHAFLTNDQSEDHFEKVLKPYVTRGLVSLENARTDLDFFTKEEWHKNEILQKARKEYRWVAFLDTDEFIYLAQGDVKFFLADYADKAGVTLNRFFYGTSGVESLGADDLLIEKMTRRFPDDYHEHRPVKTIAQSGKGLLFFNKNPHYPQYSPLARLCRVDRSRFRPAEKKILREPASINHYWYRSEEFYRKVKRPRRIFFEGAERRPHIESWHYQEANKQPDDRLVKYAERLRKYRKDRNR